MKSYKVKFAPGQPTTRLVCFGKAFYVANFTGQDASNSKAWYDIPQYGPVSIRPPNGDYLDFKRGQGMELDAEFQYLDLKLPDALAAVQAGLPDPIYLTIYIGKKLWAGNLQFTQPCETVNVGGGIVTLAANGAAGSSVLPPPEFFGINGDLIRQKTLIVTNLDAAQPLYVGTRTGGGAGPGATFDVIPATQTHAYETSDWLELANAATNPATLKIVYGQICVPLLS